MAVPEKYLNILNVLQRAVKNENYAELADIPLEDLKKAKHQLVIENGTSAYTLLIDTITEREKVVSIKPNYLCGPLAKEKCDENESIGRAYSDRNIFLDIPYSDYEDCEKIIRDLLCELKLTPIVAKDRLTSNAVLCKVCKLIKACKYGIADISSGSSSVVYEYGLMHGLGMKVCLLLRKGNENKFTDIEGLEHLSYKGLYSFKLVVAQWILDNIVEIDKEKAKDIISDTKKYIQDGKDKPLKRIIPKGVEKDNKGDSDFKDSLPVEMKERLGSLKKTQNIPYRLMYSSPSIVSENDTLILLKDLIAKSENLTLFHLSDAEFPCRAYELESSQKSVIYFFENEKRSYFKYFEANIYGFLCYGESIYEHGIPDFGIKNGDKEEKLISTFVTVDRLCKFILLITKYYEHIGYKGDIDIVCEFVGVKGLKLSHVDNHGFSDIIGEIRHHNIITIKKKTSTDDLIAKPDDLILDIYEEFRAAAGVKEAFNREATRWHLDKVKMELYGKDICPACNSYYKPKNRDKCLVCINKSKLT